MWTPSGPLTACDLDRLHLVLGHRRRGGRRGRGRGRRRGRAGGEHGASSAKDTESERRRPAPDETSGRAWGPPIAYDNLTGRQVPSLLYERIDGSASARVEARAPGSGRVRSMLPRELISAAAIATRVGALAREIDQQAAARAADRGRRAARRLHLHGGPGARHPARDDLRLPGRAQLRRRHRVVGRRRDHQRPGGADRRPARPAGRGHRRHRPDPALPAGSAAGARPGQRAHLRAAVEDRPAHARRSRSISSVSRPPTPSWSATAWTPGSSTGTCPTSASLEPARV